MTIPNGQEVAQYVDVDQFQPGHSVDKCGFYAVWQNAYAAHPGVTAPDGTEAKEIAQKADSSYAAYDGADISSNTKGMTLGQLYQLIVQSGHHFQNLYPDGPLAYGVQLGSFIRYWLALGYPIVVAIDEATVTDMDLKKNPYGWNPLPNQYSHIITITGMQSNGVDYLCRDTANVDDSGIRPGPRRYAMTPLKIQSATVFVPSWLARPYDATHQLPVAPAPVPAHKAAALVALTTLQDAVANFWGQ